MPITKPIGSGSKESKIGIVMNQIDIDDCDEGGVVVLMSDEDLQLVSSISHTQPRSYKDLMLRPLFGPSCGHFSVQADTVAGQVLPWSFFFTVNAKSSAAEIKLLSSMS